MLLLLLLLLLPSPPELIACTVRFEVGLGLDGQRRHREVPTEVFFFLPSYTFLSSRLPKLVLLVLLMQLRLLLAQRVPELAELRLHMHRSERRVVVVMMMRERKRIRARRHTKPCSRR